MCHTANLFFEGRGELVDGKLYIMDVVKNRLRSKEFLPRLNSICQIVTYRNAFDWWAVHGKYMESKEWLRYILNLYENPVEKESLLISFEIISSI